VERGEGETPPLKRIKMTRSLFPTKEGGARKGKTLLGSISREQVRKSAEKGGFNFGERICEKGRIFFSKKGTVRDNRSSWKEDSL